MPNSGLEISDNERPFGCSLGLVKSCFGIFQHRLLNVCILADHVQNLLSSELSIDRVISSQKNLRQ